LRRQEPTLPVGFLQETRSWRGPVERAAACAAESFHPRENLVAADMVAICRSHRLAVYPWTVDDPHRLAALYRLGVDGVFCNDPERIVRWLAGVESGLRDNGARERG
jgi:glycerophosphoryl diester phosphodiesterase